VRLEIRGEYPTDWPATAVRVRTEAGHRCVRCRHRFVPRRDAALLGVEPSTGRWSPCDEHCRHGGPVQTIRTVVGVINGHQYREETGAAWRVLTVHHLDGDKGNSAWWNLLALCQVCHLAVQGKVIPERPWLFEHTDWFKPYVAGFYAHYYAGQEITRAEAEADIGRWLALNPARLTELGA
jgi:5-methylcytosine-specific restriction endonuclease McrA